MARKKQKFIYKVTERNKPSQEAIRSFNEYLYELMIQKEQERLANQDNTRND